MIFGYVNPDLDPIVAVFVVDDNGYRWRREVIVDTGFNGDLTFPANLIQEMGLQSYGLVEVRLADGQTNWYNHYEATVHWSGGTRTVHVMESENQSLLGTNLFRGRTLTVEMWEGGDVIIDQAEHPSTRFDHQQWLPRNEPWAGRPPTS